MTMNIYSMTDTWNAGATTFTGIGIDVTDTASAAASKLLDLKVGGTSRFSVRKDGQVTFKQAGAAGSTTFDYQAGVYGATGELVIQNNQSGLNVTIAQNLHAAGFSAYTGRDNNGYERFTLGYGNSASGFPFQNTDYLEISTFPQNSTEQPPTFRLVTTGYLGGAYGQYRRFEIAADGWWSFFNIDGATINGIISDVGNWRIYTGLYIGGSGAAADPGVGIIRFESHLQFKDGVTAPGTTAGYAKMYVDAADGDLKIKFGDGTVKTIVVDT